MGGLYQWVGSILCYLILASAVRAVLPSKKYEKYIRFFMGVVLILLVVHPVTDGLGLEDRLAYYFEAVSFQREAEDLKREILGIEEQRLGRVIEEYEGAVERDVRVMAEDMGFMVKQVEVSIESDREKENYGTVSHIFLAVGNEISEEEGMDGNEEGSGWERIEIGAIEIELVEAGGQGETDGGRESGAGEVTEGQDGGEKRTEEGGRDYDRGKAVGQKVTVVGVIGGGERMTEGQDSGEKRTEEGRGGNGQDLEQLQRKVERYYGLESREVEIEFEGR